MKRASLPRPLLLHLLTTGFGRFVAKVVDDLGEE